MDNLYSEKYDCFFSVACIIIALFIVLFFALFIIAFTIEDYQIREEMETQLSGNSVIVNNYENWKKVTLYKKNTIKIPQSWSISISNNELYLTDDSNNIVAYGMLCEPEKYSFQMVKDFMCEYFSMDMNTIESAVVQDLFRFNLTEVYKISGEVNAKKKEYIYIHINLTPEYYLWLVFKEDTINTYPNSVTIAEAMCFSFQKSWR